MPAFQPRLAPTMWSVAVTGESVTAAEMRSKKAQNEEGVIIGTWLEEVLFLSFLFLCFATHLDSLVVTSKKRGDEDQH